MQRVVLKDLPFRRCIQLLLHLNSDASTLLSSRCFSLRHYSIAPRALANEIMERG
jgi:hypothetical protein